MSQAMRCVSTRVFPDPAPATISSGPPGWVTASRWTGFRSSSSDGAKSISLCTIPTGCCGNAEGMSNGMFEPDSVTWRVHADPAMLIGGMRALLVQALHPLAMAGVEQHSEYRADPWGRLQRTVEYVLTTTYGTVDEAANAGRVVQAIHK